MIIQDRALQELATLRINQNLHPISLKSVIVRVRFIELHTVLSSGATTFLDKNPKPFVLILWVLRGQGLQVKHGGFSNGNQALQLTANAPERQRAPSVSPQARTRYPIGDSR